MKRQKNIKRGIIIAVLEKLVNILEERGICYRLCKHIPEGQCETVSKIRGNELSQAMKAIVIMGKVNKKDRKYYLVVVPANQNIDMEAIKKYSGLKTVMFAPIDRAKTLTECEMGAVPPFSFHDDLHLIVDPSIKQNQEIVFNAGVLDHSIFMNIDDYIAIANPAFINIVKQA